MPTWTLKADRRRADPQRIARRLESLHDTVQRLDVQLLDEQTFLGTEDAGNLRDFAPLARLTHPERRGLQIVAEQLLQEFGWTIDLEK